jgi:hypothetical protein
LAIQAPLTSGLADTLNFDVTASAQETPTDGGCGLPGNFDLATGNSADNIASASASVEISSSRLLIGQITTNSNSSPQDVVLTFVDQEHPLDAFSQLFILNAQGQQGTIASDAGFNIRASDHFMVALDSPFETSKIIVTNFTLNGTTMQESSGNIQLANNAGGAVDGFTAIMQINHPAVIGTDSTDLHNNNQTVSDPTPDSGTFNFLYADGSNDTLNGSGDSEILSGAGPNNAVIGGSGNDILVYHPSDSILDGGAGFDILRIDQGAIYNSSLQISGASANGLSSASVNLTSSTTSIQNIEAILLTEEPIADATLGTELTLSYDNVIAFTGSTNNNLTGTAHTLFIIGSAGDDVELSGWTESSAANDYTSSGGQVFHQWTQSGVNGTATLYIDNDLQVNQSPQ